MKYLILVLMALLAGFALWNVDLGWQRGVLRKEVAEYSQARSRYLIYLAAIVGCPAKQVKEWSCKACRKYPNMKNITRVDNVATSIVGYIAYNPDHDEIVLSWRGSADIRNWVEDFTFDTLSYDSCKGCQIHAGFYQSYKSVEKEVVSALDGLLQEHPDSKFVITGHSLGAALAEVCALELVKKYGMSKIGEVHNFGCPRIGNEALAQFTHLKLPTIFRVVHHRDIVPHLPPTDFGFHHNPYEVLYTEKMDSYKVCDESGEDKTCSDRFFPDYSFSDHGEYFIPIDERVC